MRSIDKNKVGLYLKLGRILSQFVGVGSYFGSRTFDWIKLERNEALYRAVLVRSFDEGDEYSNAVMTFSTVNELEGEDDFFEGTEEELVQWLETKFGFGLDGFCMPDDLNAIYADLVSKGKLGYHLDIKND
ncbi:hypothetical protein FUAX_04530 [Fulvitalea axinellae]|uniref:Uncharacterized protein n=1 Tax=Fulvitalea axinellae TaxID=1182444 RepID=A0AAU9D5E0_9BACT|nr:hypothetical protein FUAX_04530 [Fulvitalea axinellae]